MGSEMCIRDSSYTMLYVHRCLINSLTEKRGNLERALRKLSISWRAIVLHSYLYRRALKAVVCIQSIWTIVLDSITPDDAITSVGQCVGIIENPGKRKKKYNK